MSPPPRQHEEATRCAQCGGPAEVLLTERPDLWLCQACADLLGGGALEDVEP